MVNKTENVRKTTDDGNVGCGILVGLQKVFDTVDYKILLSQLKHYRIHKVWNDWFKFYLYDHNQYVSINGYESSVAPKNCNIPQGSVLGIILFLLYINNVNQAIAFFSKFTTWLLILIFYVWATLSKK